MKVTLKLLLVEDYPAMEQTISKILHQTLNVCLIICWIPGIKGLINTFMTNCEGQYKKFTPN